eukprot:3197426-Rhodomonas_salina.2
MRSGMGGADGGDGCLQVNNINQQKLAWKAKFKGEHHEGVTADRFGMGFTPPPEAVRKTKVIQSLGDVSSADLPEAYDARSQPPAVVGKPQVG